METVGVEAQRMKPLFGVEANDLKPVEPDNTLTLTVTVVEDDDTEYTKTVKAEDISEHFAYWNTGKEYALVHKRSGLVAVVLGKPILEL